MKKADIIIYYKSLKCRLEEFFSLSNEEHQEKGSKYPYYRSLFQLNMALLYEVEDKLPKMKSGRLS